MEVFRIKQGVTGIDKNLIKDIDHVHDTRAKSQGDIVFPKFKTNIRQHSFHVRAAKAWSRIGADCKRAESIYEFKNKIQKDPYMSSLR